MKGNTMFSFFFSPRRKDCSENPVAVIVYLVLFFSVWTALVYIFR